MKNDFDNAQTKALNKLWRYLPSWFQHVILWAVILGAVCSAVWGAIKFIPDAVEWVKAKRAEQGKIDFIAQQVWTETQSNLKTLDRFLAEGEGKPARFIYDSYDKYGGQLDKETSQQIDNFYKNLKRIENGEPYTNDEVMKVKGQGADVLNFLQQDFGVIDYFAGNKTSSIVSADTHVAGGNVVSAGPPMLTKPPYGSVGEILPEKDNAKSN